MTHVPTLCPETYKPELVYSILTLLSLHSLLGPRHLTSLSPVVVRPEEGELDSSPSKKPRTNREKK